MYIGKNYFIRVRAIQQQVANGLIHKEILIFKLNELTSADRFSRVTPIENGEDGLVTCQSRENSFTLIDNQSMYRSLFFLKKKKELLRVEIIYMA